MDKTRHLPPLPIQTAYKYTPRTESRTAAFNVRTKSAYTKSSSESTTDFKRFSEQISRLESDLDDFLGSELSPSLVSATDKLQFAMIALGEFEEYDYEPPRHSEMKDPDMQSSITSANAHKFGVETSDLSLDNIDDAEYTEDLINQYMHSEADVQLEDFGTQKDFPRVPDQEPKSQSDLTQEIMLSRQLRPIDNEASSSYGDLFAEARKSFVKTSLYNNLAASGSGGRTSSTMRLVSVALRSERQSEVAKPNETVDGYVCRDVSEFTIAVVGNKCQNQWGGV